MTLTTTTTLPVPPQPSKSVVRIKGQIYYVKPTRKRKGKRIKFGFKIINKGFNFKLLDTPTPKFISVMLNNLDLEPALRCSGETFRFRRSKE